MREARGGAFFGVGGIGVHRWHLWAQLKAWGARLEASN